MISRHGRHLYKTMSANVLVGNEKRCYMYEETVKKIFLIRFGSVVFIGVMFWVGGCDANHDWVTDNLVDSDELLCTEKNRHGVLFSAGHGNSIKVGTYVNVDHGAGKPLPTRRSIRIYNSTGSPVMTPQHTEYKRELQIVGNNYYAENIMGFEVHGDWKEGGRVEVSVSFDSSMMDGDELKGNSIPNEIKFECMW